MVTVASRLDCTTIYYNPRVLVLCWGEERKKPDRGADTDRRTDGHVDYHSRVASELRMDVDIVHAFITF